MGSYLRTNPSKGDKELTTVRKLIRAAINDATSNSISSAGNFVSSYGSSPTNSGAVNGNATNGNMVDAYIYGVTIPSGSTNVISGAATFMARQGLRGVGAVVLVDYMPSNLVNVQFEPINDPYLT